MRMRLVAVLGALAVAAVALAGCSDGKKGGDGGDGGPDGGVGGVPMLHGYVVDTAIRPLEGAEIKVIDLNTSVASDAGGYFGFDDLPTEQFLVIVASKEGFLPQSKQVTLAPDTPVRLNFTLEPQPIRAPSMRQLPFEGFIGCQVATIGPTGNSTQSCNMGLEERTRFDFQVDAELVGAVIEVFWDARSEAGKTLGLRLETLELGQLNVVLGEVVGPSSLRVTVPQSVAEKYYPGGGYMRLTVSAASDATQNEAGIGESVVVQQQFQAFATLFYVEAPSCYTSYTVADPCYVP